MPSRGRTRPQRLVANPTPSRDAGTTRGMLFQVVEQIKNKRKDLSRIKGDLAYLLRRKEKLEKELLHKKGEGEKGKK